jgi:hemolysin activation/secretion protein
LRLDVFEARIAAVDIKGDPGPYLERLESLGSQLRADAPVTTAGVQAALRRMRDLPGLTLAASTVRDSAEPNAYRLNLDTQFDRLSGVVRLTNRGTDEAGPNFVMGQVTANGLFGGETNVGATFGAATDYDEYHGLGLTASVGVTERGTRLSFLGFRSRSDPHEPGVDRSDLYLRDLLTIGATRPLPGVARATAAVSIGLNLDDLIILRSGVPLRDERLRKLDVGSRWFWRSGTAQQYAATLDVSKGLDGLGSGLTANDLLVDPRRADFTLTRATFTRLTRFGDFWSMRLDALAQTSAYVLPYGERFKIGGDRLGRGFEVAEIAGDQGLGAKLEGRRRFARAPAALGSTSVYGFYDVGAAWKQDVPGRESAATAGFGVATESNRVFGSIEVAQPLTHADVEGHKQIAVFAEIAIRL